MTHVEDICENNDITPLLDLRAGSWISGEVNFAMGLYKITVECLEQNKKTRPDMVRVRGLLDSLINQIKTA